MCFTSRLYGTAAMAKRIGADLFSTTMTVSPHKNHEVIAGAGRKIAEITGTNYLDEDFKKNDGFRRSTELSKEYGLYRQNYCGCRFSMR